jgi:hypothetical protein
MYGVVNTNIVIKMAMMREKRRKTRRENGILQ